jgi:hypothetical protein
MVLRRPTQNQGCGELRTTVERIRALIRHRLGVSGDAVASRCGIDP